MRDLMTTKGGQAFLLKIIEMYRDSPCLWYQGNSDFRDNAKRNIALDKILEFYKTRDPSASRDTVFKKLSNIRSSYKKEMRKVYASMKKGSDHVHVPRLWYFRHLHFLQITNENKPIKNTENIEIETVIDELPIEEDTNESSLMFVLQTNPDSSPVASPVYEPLQKQAKIEIEEHRDTLISKSDISISSPSLPHESYGKHIAEKLRSMPQEMVPYCQKLINEAIFQAEMNCLNMSTRIVTDDST